LIAGKLIKSGRKFILKLQEDFGLTGRSIMSQREGLGPWSGLHSRERKLKERGESPYKARFVN